MPGPHGHATPAPAVAQLVERCRAAGMKVTPQRVAVYEAVCASPEHPTPEGVYQSVRQRMPTLSLATVYKTLETLEGLGLVSRVANIGETRRYDARVSRHHHLICVRCQSITDFEDPGFDALRPSVSLDGFVPESLSVQLLGTCSSCRAEEPAESAT